MCGFASFYSKKITQFNGGFKPDFDRNMASFSSHFSVTVRNFVQTAKN